LVSKISSPCTPSANSINIEAGREDASGKWGGRCPAKACGLSDKRGRISRLLTI